MHRLLLVIGLSLGVATPVAAATEGKVTELRAPAPLPESTEALRAKLVETLDETLRPAFFAVVADANTRLLASRRAAENSGAAPMSAREAARAALFDADFAHITGEKRAVVDAAIDMTVLQMSAHLHAALRDRVGRQLAIRAVRACGNDGVCLEAIAPTDAMTAAHVAAVITKLAGKGKELDAQDRLGNFEVQRLTSTFKLMGEILSNVSKTRSEISMTFARNARA